MLPILRRDPWFGSLSDTLADAIATRLSPVDFADGEAIYRAGDRPDGLFAIQYGSVRMMHISTGGVCGFCYVKQAPSWFGELSEFDGGPRAQHAYAVGQTRLLHLSHHAFQTIVAADGRHWSGFALLMGMRVRDLFHRIEAMATLPARVRVAQALFLTHVEAQRAGVNPGQTSISQESLGAMVGISRQTISKILKEMERSRWVRLNYRSIELLDPAMIERLARPPDR
ncbi:MAG: Crp/Fnr family transcriptional regulator [Burkholderiaceae bacterium]